MVYTGFFKDGTLELRIPEISALYKYKDRSIDDPQKPLVFILYFI